MPFQDPDRVDPERVVRAAATADALAEAAAVPAETPGASDGEGGEGARGGLTELERGVLDLEAATWRHGGAKDHAVRERLGLSPTAYYQVLNGLLDREAALAYRPLLVSRLLRSRGTRRRASRRPPEPPSATPASRQEN